MTIFVEITKQFLRQLNFHILETSESADRARATGLLSWLSPPRDAELSAAKRVKITELATSLVELDTNDMNDEIALQTIKNLITRCKSITTQLAEEKRLPEGGTELTLAQALELTQAVYDKFSQFELLNIQRDEDNALMTFQYHVAHYCAKGVQISQHLGVVGRVTQMPKISDIRLFAQKQDNLIRQSIERCKLEISQLDPQNPQYQSAIISRVITNIEDLKRKNATLMSEVSFVMNTTTAALSIFGLYESHLNQFEASMNMAIGEIGDIHGLPSPVH